MNVSTLISDLRDNLGVDSQDLGDAAALRLLNRSYREIENKFPFKSKDYRFEFATVIGTYKYDLSAVDLEAIETVAIEDPISGQKGTLDRMTKTWYEDNISTSVDAYACPTNYLRESTSCIILYPTPDAVYNITCRLQKNLTSLANDSDVPDLPEVWHEIILYGAVWRGFAQLGDVNRSKFFKDEQIGLIVSTVPVEAKEEFDTHMGGVEVYGREDYRRSRR